MKKSKEKGKANTKSSKLCIRDDSENYEFEGGSDEEDDSHPIVHEEIHLHDAVTPPSNSITESASDQNAPEKPKEQQESE